MTPSPRDIDAFMAVTQPSAEVCAAVGQRVLGASPVAGIESAMRDHISSPGAAAAHRVTARVLMASARP
ncbi:MAG: hypothetical protein ACI9MC_001282, partial [Kiritimatiellia bacterium]